MLTTYPPIVVSMGSITGVFMSALLASFSEYTDKNEGLIPLTVFLIYFSCCYGTLYCELMIPSIFLGEFLVEAGFESCCWICIDSKGLCVKLIILSLSSLYSGLAFGDLGSSIKHNLFPILVLSSLGEILSPPTKPVWTMASFPPRL